MRSASICDRGDGGGIGGDGLRIIHGGDIDRQQVGMAIVGGDGAQFLGGEEITQQHGAMCQRAIGTAQGEGGGECHKLVSPRVHPRLDRVQKAAPGGMYSGGG